MRPLAPDGRGRHQAHRQLPEAAGQGVALGQAVEEGAGQVVLGFGPRPGGGVVGVLQPAGESRRRRRGVVDGEVHGGVIL